ncbi:MAG: DUF2231 domain-containing protein [Nocardioidaceae bacterium]
MFDTIGGLPVHALVVHAVVVLGPLAGLMLVAYAVKASWRRGLRWPTLAMAAISALSAAVATSSGEDLEHRVGDPAYDHAEKGDLAAVSIYVLLGVAVVVILFLLRANADASKLTAVGVVLAVLAAGFSWFGVFNAGHSGASSVWHEEIANSTSGGGGD